MLQIQPGQGHSCEAGKLLKNDTQGKRLQSVAISQGKGSQTVPCNGQKNLSWETQYQQDTADKLNTRSNCNDMALLADTESSS